MIIKLEKVISCSSEHASYPASNLLQYRSDSSWRCAQPGCMLAKVIFQLAEPSCITGMDIGNYKSCVVIVTASTSDEPDNWVPIVNHQFMTHDEAANGKFKDQVQIFTKKELNPDALKIKFHRIQVTCMQSANLKELFGLSFIVFKTEVQVDLGLDVFGRFKLKKEENNDDSMDTFKEKYLKQMNTKSIDYKAELLNKIKEEGMSNFSKRQEVKDEPRKRPLLEKLEAGKADEVFGSKQKNSDNAKTKNNTATDEESFYPEMSDTPSADKTVKRTPFGDVIPSTSSKPDTPNSKKDGSRQSISRKRSLSTDNDTATPSKERKTEDSENKGENSVGEHSNNHLNTKGVPERAARKKAKQAKKATKPFSSLFEDISFALSGYVNPKRDQIRKKALQMGAKYIADPNTSNKRCTHLICAFKNTPKYQQLKGHCKIVTDAFIEDCFLEKIRFPWRRYALDKKDRDEPESEEEISAETTPPPQSVFDVETDPDSDSNY